MNTLQNTINFAQTFIEYAPLTAGTGFEPALSIATMVRNTTLNAPFIWPWNRNEFILTGATALAQGTQDYTFLVTDFAYLEKVSLLNAAGTYGFELKDVYNTNILGIPTTATAGQAEPNAAAVRFYTPATSMALRFYPNPDQAYTGTLTYQKLSVPFVPFSLQSIAVSSGIAYYLFSSPQTLAAGNAFANQLFQISGFNTPANNGTFLCTASTSAFLQLSNSNTTPETKLATAINIDWFPIPDSFSDIYNNLFLAEAMASVDDAREQLYRQRGIAALLSKAEGLTDMQVNVFLSQWMQRGTLQSLSLNQRRQMGNQARGI